MQETDGNHDKSVRVAGLRAEVRTQERPHTLQKWYALDCEVSERPEYLKTAITFTKQPARHLQSAWKATNTQLTCKEIHISYTARMPVGFRKHTEQHSTRKRTQTLNNTLPSIFAPRVN